MLKIGNLELKHGIIQSPMAGCTDAAFRLIGRPFGLELAYLEMISSEALVRQTKKTLALLKTMPQDRPLGAQIFGARPLVMADAAKICEDFGVDLLDINFGCPVPKIAGKGSGCAFLKKPKDAEQIIGSVVKSISKIPVTIKTRLGITDSSGKEAVALAKIAENCGCAAITVHGRTQKQGYGGMADYDGIRRVKQAVGIPVIGNGDIFSRESAARMLRVAEVDGIMIGRGALGNPWLYQDLKDFLAGEKPAVAASFEEKKDMLLRHLDLECANRDERTAVLYLRRIACWYLTNLPGVSHFRGRLNSCKTTAAIRDLITAFNPF